MTADLPTWERRVRSSQLASFSLLGPAVRWADDVADRGVVLANLSGRMEVYAFDASVAPARLTQVTDRPQGTVGAAVAPDASAVFWFDDRSGDELGRWQRVAIDDGVRPGQPVTLLPDLPASYTAGIEPLPGGGAAVGRLTDDGFELAVAAADGSGSVVHSGSEPAYLVDVAADAGLALLTFAPGGDWLHQGVRVVGLGNGEIVAELVDDGRNLNAAGFRPADPTQVLVVHERNDRLMPMVWRTSDQQQEDVVSGLAGDVTADWYPDGRSLLLTALNEARHRLYRFDPATGQVAALPFPAGSVIAASARPDGSVHALLSRSDLPVSLLRVDGAEPEQLVVLPGDPPPATVAASDVFADGPGGRVHGLLYVPDGRTGPHPTVFVVHGGPTGQDFDGWNDTIAAAVDHGYAVVRVNYRGSTGYGAAWRDALHQRVGFIELEDITAVRERLVSEGVVDPARVAILGGSWGGFLTLMALGLQPDVWRSGVALVPLADQLTSAEDVPSWLRAYDRSLMGGSVEEIPDVYIASSPITYADAVKAPVFITAGENDPRCPVRQVDTYVERLRSRGHDVRYDRLDAGHGMPDMDMKVGELRGIFDFLVETLPPDA